MYTKHDLECQIESPINRSQFVHNRKKRGSRRDFLQLAGAFAAGTTCGDSQVKAGAPDSPPIGIPLATTFTSGALEARLDGAKACGLAYVQMSMACVNLPEMPDQIPAELPGLRTTPGEVWGTARAQDSLTGTESNRIDDCLSAPGWPRCSSTHGARGAPEHPGSIASNAGDAH